VLRRYYSYATSFAGDLVSVDCAVCRGNRTQLLGVDHGFRVVKCVESGCGFVYVSPRPTAAQLETLYEGYFSDAAESPEVWATEMHDVVAETRDFVTANRPPGTMLDIGASYGYMLRAMEEAGWDTVGVEPSPSAAAYAAEHVKGEVIRGLFEHADLADGSFDAVTALYVLEHVEDPRAFLEKVHRLLRPGGLAVVRVPHARPLMPMNRLLRRPLIEAPMHLSDFSPRSMSRLGRELGFASVQTRIGRPRRATDPVERWGALVLGTIGIAIERATSGRVAFPLTGAKTYLLTK
jgi:SAM-dependent methyltransferase